MGGPEGFYAPPVQGGPVVPSAGPQWPYPDQPGVCAPQSPACDSPFRFQTRRGGTITGIPRTLLWEPPLAAKREPRFQLMPTTLDTSVSQSTLDTSIGTTLGLVRYEPADRSIQWQFDAFALVYSRFSNYDVLLDSDYRYGFPVTFSSGPWHGKIAYEHLSSHLGDEPFIRDRKVSFDYIRDEIVVAVGRYFCDYRMRVYGQAGWSFNQYIPGDPPPYRFDTGIEWTGGRSTSCWGRPFGAANVTFDGAVDYDPNFTLQLGWQWREAGRRLGQCRVFGEYYTGYSPYGQFFYQREQWLGVGVGFDY